MDLVGNTGYFLKKEQYGYRLSYSEKPKNGGNKYIEIKLQNEEKTQYYYLKASNNYDLVNYRTYYSTAYQDKSPRVSYYSYSYMKNFYLKLEILGEENGIYLLSKTEVNNKMKEKGLIISKDFWFIEDKILGSFFYSLKEKSTDLDFIKEYGDGKLLEFGKQRYKPNKEISYLPEDSFRSRISPEDILVCISGNIYSKKVYVDSNGREYINGGRQSRKSRLYLKENHKYIEK